jgi:methylated-DNA-protein-cysteine methyltransferase-like protein
MKDSYRDILTAVKQIPRGKVATYGQIAALAGLPRQARLVGQVLSAAGDLQLPWHRVINARGMISSRREPGAEEYQRILLEDEGIVFDDNGRVPLSRFQWRPDSRR